MMRKSLWFIAFCLIGVNFSCDNEKDPYFNIGSDQVGLINRQTLFTEISEFYGKDSIVTDTSLVSIGNGNKKLKIYEKGGKHLLTVTANEDSIPGIGHIQIADPRYKTELGVGLQSNFADIKKNYTIAKIVTSLNNVVVLLEGSDIYMTIDKKELPAHLRYTKSRPIELVEIPDIAEIKYLMVGWE